MSRNPYGLPSLKMLKSFECAARCGSIKDAAAELFVTPGAVSHQVKALEQELGVQLFIRSHRAVELTPEGWVLKDALSRGFFDISRAIKSIQSRVDPNSVTIGATTAVSSLWLTPRISRFWRDHGEITINQHVRDRPFVRPVLLDLVIEYRISAPDEPHDVLFDDVLIPLCAPDFDRSGASELGDIAALPLIHLDAKETNWTSWQNWFDALNYNGELSTRHRVNNYTIALQLAKDGQGVVLGWQRLVAPLLDAGELIVLGRYRSAAPGRFYLIHAGIENNAQTALVRQWLINDID
ncbi:LysR family transcriptional regulator [Amylibacter ulvae]|uniref:LysR family transcriptional regulator n=1 Tax=Paramylibacter ulvae TaxID=1651968 RepID=A0ABQ3CXS1_9RHOB|nr:LysR family transcriptional regulator [Amylibacter ulvae]GHA46187.1 LysR family transcriptional regulator [Amylibacter ulvae]